MFIVDGKPFALELKSPTGRLSPSQIECHAELRIAGCTVGVADNIDDAVGLLETWGVLPEARR
jgi:hypothetical protein